MCSLRRIHSVIVGKSLKWEKHSLSLSLFLFILWPFRFIFKSIRRSTETVLFSELLPTIYADYDPIIFDFHYVVWAKAEKQLKKLLNQNGRTQRLWLCWLLLGAGPRGCLPQGFIDCKVRAAHATLRWCIVSKKWNIDQSTSCTLGWRCEGVWLIPLFLH